MLKSWTLAALLLGATMSSVVSAVEPVNRPPIGKHMQAYSSVQSVNVRVLRVGERSANQALVQIDGIDHEWDKRIQKMDIEKTFKDTRYSIDLQGKRYIALIVNNGFGELHLPGENQPSRVFSNPVIAEEGNPEYFLTDYLQQREARQ